MIMEKTIRYYFWTMSDWAYLGHRRLIDIASRYNAVIDYRPIDLPAVYARTGGTLLGQRSRQRQDYRMAELGRWKARLHDPIVIEPKHFPAEYDLASRLLVAAKLAELPLAGSALTSCGRSGSRTATSVTPILCAKLPLAMPGMPTS